MAKLRIIQLNNIWKDRGIPAGLKLKIMKCLIWLAMTFGCEAWTMKKDVTKREVAAEIWFYHRLLRVKWTDKRTNESFLKSYELADRFSISLTFVNTRGTFYFLLKRMLLCSTQKMSSGAEILL